MKMTPRRFDESREGMESILREETLGYLGLSMEGIPYVVPLNYGYVEGKILFHCALTGKKLDYLKANPRVCFTVGRQLGRVRRHPQGAACHVDNDSVICYGTARIVEDVEERRQILNTFNRCLQPDAADITFEDASKCYAVEVKVSEMTGRQQRRGGRTHWRYSFGQRDEEGRQIG
jgi:nitroimidazol reductase NimA-like FMN-containing flavoprotein (pyridoxamine 5'-phosphate oxidase superfamily)